MKILNEATASGKSGGTHVLILDKQEARLLIEMAQAAYKANKKKSTFKRMWDKLESCLECW